MINIESVLKKAFEILDNIQKGKDKTSESKLNLCVERRCAAEEHTFKKYLNQENPQENLFKLFQD